MNRLLDQNKRVDVSAGWHWTKADNTVSEAIDDCSSLPKISIVTPSLNQGHYLEATIQSVLDQGYQNLEYIIIDGGSSDNSVDIIKKYQDQIHYWCSEPDSGHYAAINKGFDIASGDIFAWINSDDLYCPWALHTVAQAFTQFQHMQWLSTLFPLSWDDQGYCSNVGHLPGFSRVAFLDGCYLPKFNDRVGWIQQESTFWRRKLWEDVGGLRDAIKLAADFDLWARFYEHTELYGINTPLGGFRLYSNQRSLDISAYFAEAEIALFGLRESTGYHAKPDSLLRNIFSKIPIIRIYSDHYFKNRLQKYTGTQLIHAGREYSGLWKEMEIPFFSEFIRQNKKNSI